MIKDYWIYQERDVATPWALYIVKEFDRRYPEATCIDYTIYHEDIANATHSKSYVGIHSDTVGGYVDSITAGIAEFTKVSQEDKEQLHRSIENILLD